MTKIWGHRGAMDFAPQNTLPSFALAVEQGADGIELDVQLTSDGELVVFHDAHVDKLTNGRGPLASLPWSVVKELDAGSHFGREWGQTRIPTLEAVLAALPPRLFVNVELKTALSESGWWLRWTTLLRGPRRLSAARVEAARRESAPLAAATAKVLRQTGTERFIVSSFDPLALEAFRHELPAVPLGFLHSPTEPWNTPALMDGVPHEAWHPHHTQVTAEAVKAQHALGRKVHTWTVNDAEHALRLTAAGVDALITNRPGEIRAALTK
jgi:glycerophosphoryl diester phosphodiesterase